MPTAMSCRKLKQFRDYASRWGAPVLLPSRLCKYESIMCKVFNQARIPADNWPRDMQENSMRLFIFPIFIFIIALIGSFFIRYSYMDVLIVLILCLLEMSISFDNAVVNAKVLKHMSPFWRRAFLTVGILIAVFGMRLVFPIAMVAVTSHASFVDVFHMALNQPKEYQAALEPGLPMIFAFGAGFLWMVFWHFLCDRHKQHNWVTFIEKSTPINFFKKHMLLVYLFPLFVAIALYFYSQEAAVAWVLGVLVNGVLTWFNQKFSPEQGVKSLMAGGFIAFMYLEVLDASFSLDGVLGAFALSNHIFIIMIGLGLGAVFVRSMTIYLVDNDTLKQFTFLEHGAHYAIGFLALVMFCEIFFHVPSLLAGLVGIACIAKSVWDSRA